MDARPPLEHADAEYLVAWAHRLRPEAGSAPRVIPIPGDACVIAIGQPAEIVGLLVAGAGGLQAPQSGHASAAPADRSAVRHSGASADSYPLSAAADRAGRILANAIFKDRRGHGGGPAARRNMRHDELAALLACAFQLGADGRAGTAVQPGGAPCAQSGLGHSHVMATSATAKPQPGGEAGGTIAPLSTRGDDGDISARDTAQVPAEGEGCGNCAGSGRFNPDPEDPAQEDTCGHCHGSGRATTMYERCTNPTCGRYQDGAGWSCRALRDGACQAEHEARAERATAMDQRWRALAQTQTAAGAGTDVER